MSWKIRINNDETGRLLTTISIPTKHLKRILAWCFYDWASSSYSTIVITFVFSTYFTQKVAINKIIGTAQWGDANTLIGILIAVMSPILGAVADFQGRRKPWIAIFSLSAILSAAGLWFILPETSMTYLMLTLFIIGGTSIEVALVFYNSMLYDLAPPGYLGRVSGYAWGMGYLGGIVSLSIALLFVRGHFSWLHLNQDELENVRICGPLVAIWLFVFSLPLFLIVPDQKSTGLSFNEAIKKGLASLANLLISMSQYKNIFKFLLARMIYIDGLNTLFAFAGIYAAGSMHMDLQEVILLGIVLNISAGIGAALCAGLDDARGSRFTILSALSIMIIFGILLLTTYSTFWFWLFAIGISLGVGPVQAASRSYLVRLAPPEMMTELFGLFALSGKATAFLGPWILGAVTLYFNSQRAGMATIFIFFAIGGGLLLLCEKNWYPFTRIKNLSS